MNILLNAQLYGQLYNCSEYPPESIPIDQRSNFRVGGIMITLFIVFEFSQVLCVFAMFELRKCPCYLLMFIIGISDMCSLVTNGLISGIFQIQGAVFCTDPLLNFCCGMAQNFFWCISSTLNIILAVERCVEMIFPRYVKLFFDKGRVKFWIFPVFPYATYYGFFTMPGLYSSLVFTPNMDPFVGYRNASYTVNNITDMYNNVLDQYHCITISLIIPAIYAVFCIILLWNFKQIVNMNTEQEKMRRSIFLQVMVVSLLPALFFSFYYLQIPVLLVFSMYFAIINNGLPALIYLTMNRTLRSKVRKLLRKRPNTNQAAINAWS